MYFCCLENAVVTLAGVDTNPFQAEINQLAAVKSILTSINKRVVDIISHPPEPGEPSPNVTSAVKKAESALIRLKNTYNILTNIYLDVNDYEPTSHCTYVPGDPFCEDVVTALESVGDAAQVIVASIGFTAPPDDTMPFEIALWDVQDSAQKIVDIVNDYLTLPSDCGWCASIADVDDCGLALGCSWVSVPGVPKYCCTDPGPGY